MYKSEEIVFVLVFFFFRFRGSVRNQSRPQSRVGFALSFIFFFLINRKFDHRKALLHLNERIEISGNSNFSFFPHPPTVRCYYAFVGEMYRPTRRNIILCGRLRYVLCVRGSVFIHSRDRVLRYRHAHSRRNRRDCCTKRTRTYNPWIERI